MDLIKQSLGKSFLAELQKKSIPLPKSLLGFQESPDFHFDEDSFWSQSCDFANQAEENDLFWSKAAKLAEQIEKGYRMVSVTVAGRSCEVPVPRWRPEDLGHNDILSLNGLPSEAWLSILNSFHLDNIDRLRVSSVCRVANIAFQDYIETHPDDVDDKKRLKFAVDDWKARSRCLNQRLYASKKDRQRALNDAKRKVVANLKTLRVDKDRLRQHYVDHDEDEYLVGFVETERAYDDDDDDEDEERAPAGIEIYQSADRDDERSLRRLIVDQPMDLRELDETKYVSRQVPLFDLEKEPWFQLDHGSQPREFVETTDSPYSPLQLACLLYIWRQQDEVGVEFVENVELFKAPVYRVSYVAPASFLEELMVQRTKPLLSFTREYAWRVCMHMRRRRPGSNLGYCKYHRRFFTSRTPGFLFDHNCEHIRNNFGGGIFPFF